ncbi:protein CutA homolog isoform X2 [Sander vitreus]
MHIGLPSAETLQGGSFKALVVTVLLSVFMFPLLRTVGLRAFSMASETYTSGTHSAAFVTCPNDTVAKDLARGIVERKLAACVNIVPAITSVYEWQGKIEEDNEVLLMQPCLGTCKHLLRLGLHGNMNKGNIFLVFSAGGGSFLTRRQHNG